MRTCLIALSLVGAAGVAMADGMENEATADQTTTATAPSKAPAHYRGSKRLPGGDIRHCLDLKTSAAIIRCSETQRKK